MDPMNNNYKWMNETKIDESEETPITQQQNIQISSRHPSFSGSNISSTWKRQTAQKGMKDV